MDNLNSKLCDIDLIEDKELYNKKAIEILEKAIEILKGAK